MRYGCLQERPLQNRANFLSVIPDLFVSYRVFFSPFSANDPGRITPNRLLPVERAQYPYVYVIIRLLAKEFG
jgi:hypothetical protein